MKRVLIFIVTYNAERTVQSVLSRVPDSVLANPDYQTQGDRGDLLGHSEDNVEVGQRQQLAAACRQPCTAFASET